MNKRYFFLDPRSIAGILVLGLFAGNVSAATLVSDSTVSLSGYTGAVCNNGEPANMRVTTVADGAGISNKWLIHFEGGGSCKDDSSCQQRWLTEGHNMRPASGYPAGGLANLSKGNGMPLDGYNTVQLHYCSSDGWSGARTGSVDGNGDPVVFNGTDTIVTDPTGMGSGVYGLHFRGKRIFQAALSELESVYTLSTTATDIVLAGKSAGSIGVQSHIDKVDALFGSSANVRGLMIDTWVPFLPLAGTETQVRSDLAGIGISQGTIDELLEFANFDADVNLQASFDTAAVWGSFNNISAEGWPGPAACFNAISGLPSVIANPHHLMLCSVHDFVLDPYYNDGTTPFISTEMLILRNFYDVAVGLAAFGLFPDHAGFTAEDFAAVLQDVLGVQALSELKNYIDGEARKDVLVDQNSELAVALYTVLLPLSQSSLEAAAGADNVTVFAPGLEMSTQNCNIFNLGACNFPESQRRGLPTHGVLDLYLNGSCSSGYAALFGQSPGSVKCTNTFAGQLIQPYNSSALGPARTIKQYLDGWADGNSTFDYNLVGDVKFP